MPKCQPPNAISDSQKNMSLLESSNPTTAGPEKCNRAQDKDTKIAFMNILEVPKE